MGPLQRLGRLGTHAGIVFMRLLAPLPLPWVRFLGVCLGYVLYAVVLPRRRVVHTNLAPSGAPLFALGSKPLCPCSPRPALNAAST